jgi:hypothetical protein
MVTIGLQYSAILINSQNLVISAKHLLGKNAFLPCPLQPVLMDFPFSKWGLDFIGPINPPYSTGHIFILTTTDYFTKWTKVITLRHAWDEQIIYFLESNIFSRFDIPLEIITDN